VKQITARRIFFGHMVGSERAGDIGIIDRRAFEGLTRMESL
jgi:hypothetical protein